MVLTSFKHLSCDLSKKHSDESHRTNCLAGSKANLLHPCAIESLRFADFIESMKGKKVEGLALSLGGGLLNNIPLKIRCLCVYQHVPGNKYVRVLRTIAVRVY